MSGADEPWGVYVHVPWCRRRCPYCSFYVEVDRGPDHAAYADAVLGELASRRAPFDAAGPPATLFFGGGTPSRLPAPHLRRIVQAVGVTSDAEISLEANPEDLDPATLDGLRDAGVNRLSIGLQTFQPDFARLLNRAGTVAEARAACAAVQGAGFRSWSVDLIFGLPGQTLADLERDLEALAEVDPPHVSLYGLTFEPGTPFERAQRRGKLLPVDEDLWADMVERIAASLHLRGLRRYEISNFARPGHESRHNRLYWRDRPYLGLGPSAHGYRPDGSRYHNPPDLGRWSARPGEAAEDERPTPAQAALDLLISSLRDLEHGLDLDHMRRRTGLIPEEEQVADLIERGLLESAGTRIRLTHAGTALADGLADRLGDALRPAP